MEAGTTGVTTLEGRTSLLAEERRRRILEVLARRGAVQVVALSQSLGCSEATLRRDLQRLEEEGLLRRTHGGAMVIDDGFQVEPIPQDKAVLQVIEKRAIGIAAARLLTPGEVVALTGGTTTLEVARRLRLLERLRVVTNSVGIAAELAGVPAMEVTLTGGTLRGSLELTGPQAEQSLRNVYVDVAFIGVDGLTVQHGLTTYNQTEAYINRTMIGQARRVVVVADHTKIGRVTMALIAPVQAIATLVTDDAARRDRLDEFRDIGIEVVVAS
jgi:DeoR/GlpR family transcriptional regulator of sugar metabolism